MESTWWRNSKMNYSFWWDGQPWGVADLPIGHIFREEWQRPEIGMEVRIKGKVVRVTRTSPSGNPTGVTVKYYVEELNGNKPYKQNK